MNEIDFTCTPSQLRVIQESCKFMRDHCDQVLSGIASMKPLPPAAAAAIPEPATVLSSEEPVNGN